MNTATTAAPAVVPQGDNYDTFLHDLQARFGAELQAGENLLFTTDAEGLFDAYLATIPAEHRQYYTCSCCRHFVSHFGGLVTIDAQGNKTPLLWGDNVTGIHREGVAAMARLVRRAKVTGVFLSSEAAWGQPEAGGFQHMHVTPTAALLFKRTVLTAGQKMAEKREDFGIVGRALAEFTPEHIQVALNVLRSDKLYSAEKVIGPAEFLAKLHADRHAAKGSEAKANILWRAVAAAPAGFCHPRSSMIGTLLEDIAAGMDFDTVARRFSDKMHPLRYQRPQAAPTSGNIAQAEKLFEQLGLAPALERRIARLEEVPKVWEPRQHQPQQQAVGGVFGHLQPKGSAPAPVMEIPAITMTLQKFVQTVATGAEQIEVQLGGDRYPFIAITTAANDDAPRLFQWDHPFAWYVWNGGSPASQYGLQPGWAKVSGITRLPARWNDDGQRFKHHGDGVILLLDGAIETREAGAALFPNLLRSELHGVRATIEAHSRSAKMGGLSEGTAVGYDMRESGAGYPVILRVTAGGQRQAYKIDRWD
jgi:hypothetical protein